MQPFRRRLSLRTSKCVTGVSMRLPPSCSREEVEVGGGGIEQPIMSIQQMREARMRQMKKKWHRAKKREGYYRWLKVNSLLDAGSTLFMSPCGVGPADKRRRRSRERRRHGPSPPSPPLPGAASPPFPHATSARTSLRRAQNSAQLLRQDAPPCARTRVGCCYCCYSAQRRRRE